MNCLIQNPEKFPSTNITRDMMVIIRNALSKWTSINYIKIKDPQIIDFRWDLCDQEFKFNPEIIYYQAEDKSMYVTTLKFKNRELVEIYRVPEYEKNYFDIIKRLSDPLWVYFSYTVNDEFWKASHPLWTNCYAPLKQKEGFEWISKNYPKLIEKADAMPSDYFILRFDTNGEVDKIYYTPKPTEEAYAHEFQFSQMIVEKAEYYYWDIKKEEFTSMIKGIVVNGNIVDGVGDGS